MAIILTRAGIQRCLSMRDAINAMHVAFPALSAGEARAPRRGAVTLAEEGVARLIPPLLQTMEAAAFGLKIVTVKPRDPHIGVEVDV